MDFGQNDAQSGAPALVVETLPHGFGSVADMTEARMPAVRTLGRTGAELPLHARVPRRILPAEEAVRRIGLGRGRAFAFPAGGD